MSSVLIQFTAQNGVDLARPKYFTGKMLERWPELLSNPERAFRFDIRSVAKEFVEQFRLMGFACDIVPAPKERGPPGPQRLRATADAEW